MLTQSDIDFLRFELQSQVENNAGAPVIEPEVYAELLDAAETLLALEWAEEFNRRNDCPRCPFGDGNPHTRGCSMCAYPHDFRAAWHGAYQVRG